MNDSFAEKVVLVTGATSGIGHAVAVKFAESAARVVALGRNQAALREVESAVKNAGGEPLTLTVDVTDSEQSQRAIDETINRFGRLDVLVNAAGHISAGSIENTSLAAWDAMMNVNVRGYLLYAQSAYPHLARRRGCMIHIASDAGIWGEQATGLYSVTKAAVVMLGKMLALDGGRDGVRSNVLCPGDIWPGMRHMAPPGEQASTKQDRAESADGWPVPPIGRVGQASDVADAAVFYASDQAEFITGTTLLVDGGMTAGYLQRERGGPA